MGLKDILLSEEYESKIEVASSKAYLIVTILIHHDPALDQRERLSPQTGHGAETCTSKCQVCRHKVAEILSLEPLGGVALEGVELGRASSASGFDSTIVLTPTVPVDLLTLIRENDNNPALGCPELQIYVVGDAPASEQPITWQAEANVDVYALLG